MIRVAVIGAGHWGPHLIRNFHNHQESIVTWASDLDALRLQEISARYPDVRTTGVAQEAIEATDVDAVVVATPTSTHYPLAKAALQSGKHVLVEKPLASSSAEGEELCELSRAQDRTLMVGHVFVFNAGVRYVKDYLDAGKLGRLYYISMVRTNLGPVRVDVNAAWDLAAHDLSIASYWLGQEPLNASAIGGSWINPGLEDAIFANLRYPEDVLVNLQVSWLNPRKTRDITVVGDSQMLVLDDMNIEEPVRIYDKGIGSERTTPVFTDTFASFRASIREGDITIPRVPVGEPLKAECQHFLECIIYGKEPVTGGAEGLKVLRALEAIDRSIENGGRAEAVR
jgi:predicted dehydrogenase